MWPAWWTLGVDGEWPAGGEIDMLEYLPWHAARQCGVGIAAALGGDVGLRPHAGCVTGAGWADGFHVWRMDWDAEAIRLYMDDRLLNETAVSDTIDASRHRDPFNAPHYMLLNLAIGGTTAATRPLLRSLRASRSTTFACTREKTNREWGIGNRES